MKALVKFSPPKVRESMSELERFLTLLGDRLSRGICQEEAFTEAFEVYDGTLRGVLELVEGRILNGVPLEEALFELGLQSSLPEFRGVMMTTSRLIRMGSKEAGERILLIVSRLRENRRLMEERESYVRAMSFKGKVLTLGCSISVALLTVLLPAFSAMAHLTYPAWSNASIFTFGGYSTLAVTLSVCCAISAYYAASVSQDDSPLTLSLLAAVSYWLVFITATVLLTRVF